MNIKEQLNEIIQKYDLINAAYDYFWKCYEHYIVEYSDEAQGIGLIDSSSIKINLYSMQYKLIKKHIVYKDDCEFIVIIINMYHNTGNNAGDYLGYYSAFYNMDGTIDDDHFHIE